MSFDVVDKDIQTFFGFSVRFDQSSIATLAVPLLQWIAVLYVWIAIARDESREQRANAIPK